MTTSSPSRQPKGLPVGGQFASAARDEADLVLNAEAASDCGSCGDRACTSCQIALDAENQALVAVHVVNEARLDAQSMPEVDRSRTWGAVNLSEGSRTPWGPAQYAQAWAPGIVSVGCAGHGGVKLSPERNRAVPVALRNADGWYEEDCEAYIVGMVHPDAHNFGTLPVEDSQAACEAKVREWFPDAYEKATGNTIPFGESAEKDRATYRAQAEYVLGHETHRDANGVTYRTLVGRDGAKQWVEMTDEVASEIRVAVPSHFGAAQRSMLAPIVSDHHLSRVTFTIDPRESRPRFSAVPIASGETPRVRARIGKDLNKRWRRDDGSVKTLAEIIETEGMTGKSVSVENGVRRYYLQQHVEPTNPNSPYTPWQVSKETWERFVAPDTRSERSKANEAVQIASHKYEKAREKVQSSWRPSATDHDALRKAGRALEEARALRDSVAGE